jgi:hypothetical protein
VLTFLLPQGFQGHVLLLRSLNNLVGELLEMQRHVEADRLGRLKIDDKLELGWRLHWKLGWLVALENAIDIRRRTPKIIGPVNAVGQQAGPFASIVLDP